MIFESISSLLSTAFEYAQMEHEQQCDSSEIFEGEKRWENICVNVFSSKRISSRHSIGSRQMLIAIEATSIQRSLLIISFLHVFECI